MRWFQRIKRRPRLENSIMAAMIARELALLDGDTAHAERLASEIAILETHELDAKQMRRETEAGYARIDWSW